MSDGPFRDNNLDALKTERDQLKRELALVKREQGGPVATILREHRNHILALTIIGIAAATQTWSLLWILLFLMG